MCTKTLFVSDLKIEDMVGREFYDIFFLKKIAKEDNGNVSSLAIVLTDKTGEIKGRIWAENIKDEYLSFIETVVEVKGKVTTYKGSNSLSINSLQPTTKFNPNDFCDTLDNVDEYYDIFVKKYHADIKKPHFIKLLDAFFKNEACSKRFKNLQGARIMHHVKIGGFIEHTSAVYDLCKVSAGKYMLHPDFDLDILLTAAALHDVGKVYEYKPLPINQRTDIGILLGHLALSTCMVYKAIFDISDFPEEDKIKLLHCIYTSHGDQDKIIKPSCIEAIILHRIDELDARVDGFNNIIATDMSKENFTKYYSLLDQYVYKK